MWLLVSWFSVSTQASKNPPKTTGQNQKTQRLKKTSQSFENLCLAGDLSCTFSHTCVLPQSIFVTLLAMHHNSRESFCQIGASWLLLLYIKTMFPFVLTMSTQTNTCKGCVWCKGVCIIMFCNTWGLFCILLGEWVGFLNGDVGVHLLDKTRALLSACICALRFASFFQQWLLYCVRKEVSSPLSIHLRENLNRRGE